MNHVVQHGDDAVLEVELSLQDLQALTQTRTPTRLSERAAAPNAVARARRLFPRVTVGVGAASVVAVVALFVASRTPDIKQPMPASPVSAPPALVIATAPSSVEPAASPVKFTNPFDRTEVFEFPAGTSPAEAREKVAELLLKRAQERHPNRSALQLKRLGIHRQG